MLLTASRYAALAFAIGLGIGEAVINWGHWQYAPLWIVDYVIVVWLLWAFVQTRNGHHVHVLLAGWTFAAGVFYMALFVSLDPELAPHINADGTMLALIAGMCALAVLGALGAWCGANSQAPSRARG